MNYIDKTILERHKNLQEKKCVVREISLSKLQEIMDTFVENNEKEANILALKRGYLESLDKFCQKMSKK
ncbi:MAG: ABC-three component system protein [Lachnospiraceae bacterium]